MRFSQVINALFSWLRGNAIRTSSLTVIINFSDAIEAAEFEGALRREIDAAAAFGGKPIDPTDFEMFGIRIKVESPIHATE